MERTEFAYVSQGLAVEEELAGPVITNRLSSLDVLRGVAIMGILASNIEDFGGIAMLPVESLKPVFSGPYAQLNTVLFFMQQVFFFGKTRGMLALLFGAGVLLLTNRLDTTRGRQQSNVLFVRRHVWMMIFGFLHSFFIWHGDFLLSYGTTALVLLSWCRRLRTKTLLVLGILLATIPSTCGVLLFHDSYGDVALGAKVAAASIEHGFGIEPNAELQAAQNRWRANLKPHFQGRAALEKQAREGQKGYSARLHPNLKQFFGFEFLVLAAGMLDLAGLMLIGMVLVRIGFLTGKYSTRAYIWVAVLGLLVSAPLTYFGIWQSLKSGLAKEVVSCWIFLPIETFRIGMVMAYVSIILLWVRSNKGKFFLNSFASVGRMALSNYLLCSIICQTVFAWGPWKLYGQVEYFQLFVCVLGVWVFNLLFSSLWLRWFAFGPFEWTWRCLTYRRLLPISRTKASAIA
jgi:uncharacterized protein